MLQKISRGLSAKRIPEILFFWRHEKKRKIFGKSLFAGGE